MHAGVHTCVGCFSFRTINTLSLGTEFCQPIKVMRLSWWREKKKKKVGGRGLILRPTPVNQRNVNKLGEQPWMDEEQSK